MTKICVNCGVEIEDGLRVCPLCFSDPSEIAQEGGSFNYPSGIVRLHRKELKRSLWELSGIIAFCCIAVCTILDIIISNGPGWSLYSDVSTAGAWVVMTLFLHAFRKPLILLPGLWITVTAILYIFELITSGREWFLPVALPVSSAAFVSAGAIAILFRSAKLKGLNIIAAGLILLAGFCVVTEMSLDRHLDKNVHLGWSLIASVSILPFALLLFYYHYRLKKGNRLDSFFHI